ncbi:MAG: NAD+ synthase [Planctomycetes bacterium]|nr:NAD+ synthase [Planctomycetota bacterium]
MRVALAQLNPTIGDFPAIIEKMVRAALKARGEGAELTLFPELALMGYPPRDLLEKQAFLEAMEKALEKLKKALKGFPSVVGYVARRYDGVGNLCYNAAAFIDEGEVKAVARKSLLPTYDVFDERRYFEPGTESTVFGFKGLRWGLTVCEDIWNDKDFWKTRMYDRDPIEEVVAEGADIILNISASPYFMGKQAVKEAMLSSLARKHRKPVLYVNQVGGNDELIFDGRSMAFDDRGKIFGRAPAFQEAIAVVDVVEYEGDVADRLPDLEECRQALVLGMRDYGRKCGFDGAVVGLSGGIDSSLVGALAAEAFGPSNVIGVAMPSRFNAPESLADARQMAENLGLDFHILPIEKPFGAIKELLGPVFAGRPEDTTEENMQARIRGMLLMALSNKFGHLLLTTGNKSELATGYCTLYGDMCGGLAAISDVYKTTVYDLSRHINQTAITAPIPENCITRAPSAELRENQTDQDSLPPYDLLDKILKAYVEEGRGVEQIAAMGFDFDTVRRVARLVDYSEYKRRQAAPGLKISAKAFGVGRRIPIAQRFREGD